MSTDEYLRDVLSSQTLGAESPEYAALQEKRGEVEAILREAFPGVTIRYAGSYAKRTMIRASYDLDLTCYFSHEDTQAGDTLKDIFKAVEAVLQKHYSVTPKKSAIRLEEIGQDKQYTHVDVVPGRFIEGNDGDVFLHQNETEKSRLKTNLDVHVETIRDSGVTAAIRLLKYWRERQGLRVKTFVLELLAVQVLTPHKNQGLEKQLTIFWEALRDDIDEITIQDPANPEGNDLTPVLAEARTALQVAADTTLQTVDNSGWEHVFGDPDDELSEAGRAAKIASFPHVNTGRAKPWAD